MRIAATADLHFSPQSYDRIREPMSRVRDEADVLVLAGDLTNYGKPEEMDSLLNALVRLRIPTVGEQEVKTFVQAAVDEAMKLERALSQVRAQKRVVVVHYAPVVDTVRGEPPEIFPYLGSARLAEVVDRHGAVLVLHGHAHHGAAEGRTTGGVPVYNVALSILQSQNPPAVYRVFDV